MLPCANVDQATDLSANTLHKPDTISPDVPKYILGDFNHCSMDKLLKGYHQYVTCATCMHKTLHKCYGPVPGAYRSLPFPPLGSADHSIILLAPAYIPVVKQEETEVRTVIT